MPGIAGIIRKGRYEGMYQDLDLMVESMRHAPYYVGNQYLNPDAGIHLAWLSHPGSLGEHMPLISRDKRLALIVTGEHFSHVHKPISSNGNGVVGTNPHDLLKLYEECGDKFLDHLNGWFCGIAIDLNLGKVTLFNDRYGMGRIYLYEGKGEFLFASEAKSLLRIRPALRAIDPTSLAQFLRFDCVLGNKTLYKGISLLPPGSSWSFTNSGIPQKRVYFDFADWEGQPTLGQSEFCEKFEETVSRVFPKYMEGSQPVGLSLTAGLDTRVILASAREQNKHLPCYTFGGNWGEIFDIRTARKLAALCNLPYEVITINEQFFKDFPSNAQKSVYISDGAHDAFGAHDVFFNKIARTLAPIRLTGKFGSEVVRIRKLIPFVDYPRHLLNSSFVPFLNEAPTFAQVSKRKHPLSRVVTEEIPWHEFGRIAVEQSETVLRTPYMDNELVRLMYQAPPELRISRDLQAKFIIDKSRELAAFSTDLGSVGLGKQLTGRISAVPLWVLFKAEYIYLYPLPHWLTWIDRRLEKLKPETFIAGRQKYEAYRIWLKTHFAGFVQDTLLSPSARCTDFFEKTGIARVVRGHTAGTHNYRHEINKMLTVELIYSSLLRA